MLDFFLFCLNLDYLHGDDREAFDKIGKFFGNPLKAKAKAPQEHYLARKEVKLNAFQLLNMSFTIANSVVSYK